MNEKMYQKINHFMKITKSVGKKKAKIKALEFLVQMCSSHSVLYITNYKLCIKIQQY